MYEKNPLFIWKLAPSLHDSKCVLNLLFKRFHLWLMNVRLEPSNTTHNDGADGYNYKRIVTIEAKINHSFYYYIF